jgi:hypothetical protein
VISFHDPWGLLALSGVFFSQDKPEKAHPVGQPVHFETTLKIFNPLPKTKAPEIFPRSTVKTDSVIFFKKLNEGINF